MLYTTLGTSHTQTGKSKIALEKVVHMTPLCLDTPGITSLHFGTLFCTYDLTDKAWPGASKLFSCNPENQPSISGKYKTVQKTDFQSYRSIKWARHPHLQAKLEALIVQEPTSPKDDAAWKREFLGNPNWPNLKYIILVSGDTPLTTKGTGSIKSLGRQLSNGGFQPFHWWVKATACGAPIDECHLVTIGIRTTVPTTPEVPPCLGTTLPERGFNNLLLPVGIPPKAWVHKKMKPRAPSDPRPGVLGYIGGKLVNSVTHPIRPVPAQLISTDRGVRYILPCEWARLKGLSKSEAAHITGTKILDTISANVWFSIILGLEKLLLQSPATPHPTALIPEVLPGTDFDAS